MNISLLEVNLKNYLVFITINNSIISLHFLNYRLIIDY